MEVEVPLYQPSGCRIEYFSKESKGTVTIWKQQSILDFLSQLYLHIVNSLVQSRPSFTLQNVLGDVDESFGDWLDGIQSSRRKVLTENAISGKDLPGVIRVPMVLLLLLVRTVMVRGVWRGGWVIDLLLWRRWLF